MPTISDVIAQAAEGQFQPVYVLVGPERLLIDRAITALRREIEARGVPGFNVDMFDGKGLDGATVLSTARTLPMMADTRFVCVRHVDAMTDAEQAALAEYVASPNPSTCMVLAADKLDGRGRLLKLAKKQRYVVEAKSLRRNEVREFIRAETARREHPIASDAVEALVEAVGEDLSTLEDALERLSLFVGAGQRINADAVATCISRVRVESIWSLVDAIGLQDRKRGVAAAQSLLADREPPLRLLAMVARQLRIVARMREALARGLRPEEAVKEAGAPPFKARELTASARHFTANKLGAAFSVIAETDRALKSSKRPPDVLLHEAVLELCAPSGTLVP